MFRIQNLLFIISALLVLGHSASLSAQAPDSSDDILYAERVPLAAHSMMLEVVDTGNRLVAVGERGHIIFSNDRGITWQQAEIVPTRSTLTSVFALDGHLWAAGHDSVIISSSDGGNTWTRQYFDPERRQPIMDVLFHDKNNGIATGAYGLMLLTSDGGKTWEDWAVNEEDDAHLNALIEFPDGTLLIAGEAGYSYRSQDSGQTWESLDIPYGGSMFGAQIFGDSCVLFYGLRGHAMQSCDQGTTWEELDTGSQATLLGSAEQSGKVLLAGNSGSLLIYDENDGFSSVVHPSGVDFSSALALGNGRFLLTGEEGTYFYPTEATAGDQQ